MRLRHAILMFGCVASVACAALLDLQEPPGSDGGPDSSTSGNDVGVPDVGVTCVSLDAALPGDDANTAFRAFQQSDVDDAGDTAWTFFDVSTVSLTATNYVGGVFDGRYIYFAPYAEGDFLRFDTTISQDFESKSAWAALPQANLGLKMSFFGATFDGRYVYYVPNINAYDGGYSGQVVRYDTIPQLFGATTSWTTFDTGTLTVPEGGAPARGLNGAVFDGRYVYLVPNYNGVTRNGRVARYDTEHDGGAVTSTDAGDASAPLLAMFSNATAWTTFDVAIVNASALGFVGGVYDGRYVYMSPWISDVGDNGGYNSFATRYDTTGFFAVPSSWSTFEVDQVNGNAYGFEGAAYDGRYVYFVPHEKTVVARYDTTLSFDTDGAWSVFDVSTIVHVDAGAPAFSGAAFDGRFIYLVPALPGFGAVVRYDILGTFTSACAWSVDDMSRYNAQAVNFFGAVYDGRYLYFVPHGATVARFDTKTPRWLPPLPAFSGSFL
jgi:hypothetical protein